jgi:hypothetical protein
MLRQNLATTELASSGGQPKYLAAFRAELISRLQSGSHLILHGPRGSGKSTLLASMRDHYHLHATPCAIAPQTLGLPDIVNALSQAYPKADLENLGRRAIGFRLCVAAARSPGVLLLDHTRELTTATISFLRRLRVVVGVLLVVDIDSEFERDRLRTWRRHALCMRMPLMPSRRLRRLLQSSCSARALPAIDPGLSRQIVHAARGRVGWLRECVNHLEIPEYWSGGRLHVGALCTDSEIAIREGRRGPRMRLRRESMPKNP